MTKEELDYMKLKLFMVFGAAIFSLTSIAQTSENQSNKDLTSHEHHNNEIGIALAPAYFLNEKVWTFAMHLHYTRNIPKTKFGIGASFERIVLVPKHSTFGLVMAYYPIENLNFTLSPGLTFEDANPGALFALHMEATYEFEIGNFHIGPALEFAYDPNDYHLSLGIHLGYGF